VCRATRARGDSRLSLDSLVAVEAIRERPAETANLGEIGMKRSGLAFVIVGVICGVGCELLFDAALGGKHTLLIEGLSTFIGLTVASLVVWWCSGDLL
jgi:ABC-type thiamin/hydroxymethylpyrimidine transport system permease subunit